MREVLNSFKSLSKDVILSGLFVGSLEPCIEDAIMFSAKGLISISNLQFLVWIGAVELVGLGQILLLSRCFKNGKRLKVAVILWILTIPFVFLFFTLGSFLSSYIRLVYIWGPITVFFVAALILGKPLYLPRTKIPMAYISLFAGLVVDLALSLTALRTSPILINMPRSQVFQSCTVISVVMGITLLSFSYLSDRIYITPKENTKKKFEKRLKFVAISYLLSVAVLLIGVVPSFTPVLTIAVGFLVLFLTSRNESNFRWMPYSSNPESLSLKELANRVV